MKKLVLTTVVLLVSAVFPTVAQTIAPTLYGNLIYTRSWGDTDASKAGVYSFSADASGEVSLVYRPEGSNIYGNGGAVYVDGKYYVLTHVPNTGKIQQNKLYTYDADNWTLISQKEVALTTSANDLTWCPVDKKVYGAFLNTTSSGYVFGTLNLEDGTVSEIKAIDLSDNLGPMPIIALAANAEGDIYGVAADGNLYQFDRTTGDYTLVGPTGFTPARWNQSACFDFTTKEMYWAACNADLSALFKINTSTGTATNIRTFTDDEEFVGLYSVSSIADMEGPQVVDNFTVSLDGNALSGTVSFNLPSLSISGAELSGTLDYVVEENEEIILQGSGAPTSEVIRDVEFTEGLHKLVVYASSADGRGASLRHSVYAGNDTPSSPASVTAVKEGDAVNVSWEAVTTGFNKGFVDPSAITYTVTRMPGAKVVAEGITTTTCSDTELPSYLGDYTYNVSAVYAGKSGTPTSSEAVTLGSAFDAPMALDLTQEDQFKFCSVINANNDDKTWKWSANGVFCNYNRKENSDDWLVTPLINLEAGNQYIITIEMRSGSNFNYETYEIKAGHYPDVESMTVPVLEDGSLMNSVRRPQEIVFRPGEDGAYCFGIHCTSPKDQYGLYVYTFEISEPVSLKAPVASETVSATAAAEGVLEATIKALAPNKAVDDTEISTLEKAELTNITTGALVETVMNPVPGTDVTFTDRAAVNGKNKYSVVFFSSAGKGYAATTEVYVGEDQPFPVSNVKLKQVDNKAVLTWTAPTEGVNGGYVNPANLKYRVVLVSTMADVATGLTECAYTDDKQDIKTQHALQYAVYASNVAGESTGYNSNILTFGNPYPAPFSESFEGGKETMQPWTKVKEGDGYQDWAVSTMGIYDEEDSAQDSDLGWIRYSSKGTVTLQSPVIDLSEMTDPRLKFWYRGLEETDDMVKLEVLLSSDRGSTWVSTGTIDVIGNTWIQKVLDISAVKGYSTVQIGFKASCTMYQDMYLDNIRVTDNHETDLGIRSFTGPAQLTAGTSGKYSVKIVNEGVAAATDYTISVYGNDRLLTTVQGTEVAQDGISVQDIDVAVPVNFTEVVLRAVIDYAGDGYAGNNEATLTVVTDKPRFPTIDTLVATADGEGIRLSWSRPEEERNPSAVVDDLETLTAWDFGGVNADNKSGTIGDYTVYDADGAATVVVGSFNMQPNGRNPMAYQVGKTGDPFPATDLRTSGINAHSGNYSLIAWGAAQGESSDWLILPELYPTETAISFWAHAAPTGWSTSPDEKLEVLYSTTGNEIADFKVFANNVAVPCGFDSDDENGFHFYEYKLPEDARYAAIRVVLSTTLNRAVVIDDICFTSASSPKEVLEINGYNIYRDDEKIGTSDTEEYVDNTATGSHVYNVTTRYHLGESAFSNPADATTSGISNVSINKTDGEVRFYNLQGFEVKNPTRGNIYIIVRADGTSSKCILR